MSRVINTLALAERALRGKVEERGGVDAIASSRRNHDEIRAVAAQQMEKYL